MRIAIQLLDGNKIQSSWKVDIDARRIAECATACNTLINNFTKQPYIKKKI